NVQPQRASKEIDEDHADLRILAEVAEAGIDAIAVVFRIDEGPLVEDMDKPSIPSPERAVTLAPDVSRSDTDHFLLANELLHLTAQPVADLLAIKGVGLESRALRLLEKTFSSRPG